MKMVQSYHNDYFQKRKLLLHIQLAKPKQTHLSSFNFSVYLLTLIFFFVVLYLKDLKRI
jgi:hypothetical protein